jgi:hypothetical protein
VTGRTRIRAALLVWGAVCASLLGVGSAQATTVTLGSNLSDPSFNSVVFGSATTLVQTVLPGRTTVSPISGTVVQWKLMGAQGGPLRLQVIKKIGAQYESTGSQSATITGPGVLTFPSHLKISAGDLIGIANVTPTDRLALTPATAGSSYSFFSSPLADGGPPQSTAGSGTRELALQATVMTDCNVPSLKGLKLGAAQAAVTAAGCTNGTVTRPKKKAARKKAKFVVGQSPAAGTSVEALTAVDITLGKKPKKKKS